MTLLHMTTRAVLAEAEGTGEYRPASLAAEGFIHLSTPEQVHHPANALFRGRQDIVLLWLDPARLAATVLWESGDPSDPHGMRFPHLYGPLPLVAVVGTREYRPGADGTFGPPPTLDVPTQPGGNVGQPGGTR